MMKFEMEENYKWEAEKSDGTTFNIGEDLSECVRFSLIPINILLPQHDILGVKLKRRFVRNIVKNVLGNQKEHIRLHCVIVEGFRLYINEKTGTVLVTPEDYEVYL